ncbi:hypothetical protein M426DRAFT_10355 [Hypoxylon sp. CI-4A]|nr:hypothetical protein M426DRAFT_10355 [Hypoxylon sp. CI-4A]
MKATDVGAASPERQDFESERSSDTPWSCLSLDADYLHNRHKQWSDKNSCIQYLRTKLKENREFSHCESNSGYFLPVDRLLYLLRKPIIKQAFEDIFHGNEDSVNQLVNEIGHQKPDHSRLMILATLIHTNGTEFLKSFIRSKIRDFDLPLRSDAFQGRPGLLHHNGEAPYGPTMEFSSDSHRGFDPDYFCYIQYQYLIPFFDMSSGPVRFYKFDDPGIRLPFTEWYDPKAGGNGIVRRVKIHPAHHNYESPDGESEFAVKEISANLQSYRHEILALERFSGERAGHEHLIRLLMTLQHADKYYLIFPLAQGNLRDLWEQKQMPPTTPQHVEWLLDQCLGLTAGLSRIHHYSTQSDDVHTHEELTLKDNQNKGRHGDIKPENILFFPISEGNYRLVITDFGLTRFHSSLSVSNIAANRVYGYSRTYRPPEFDMESSISQAYDMWSLGCVFLEFVSWFLLGHISNARDPFNRARRKDDIHILGNNFREDKFFNIEGNGPVVKQSVKDWIQKLRAHDSCQLETKEFLDIIGSKLLQPDPKDRWKVGELHEGLKSIRDKYVTALSKPRDSYASSTLTLFDEKDRVIGDLRRSPKGPLGQPGDERQIELQRKILNETNIRREAKNAIYTNNPDMAIEEKRRVSGDTISEDTERAIQDTTEASIRPVEQEVNNSSGSAASNTIEPKPHSDTKPSPFHWIGEALGDNYARVKRVLRRITCIRFT